MWIQFEVSTNKQFSCWNIVYLISNSSLSKEIIVSVGISINTTLSNIYFLTLTVKISNPCNNLIYNHNGKCLWWLGWRKVKIPTFAACMYVERRTAVAARA